MKNISISNSVVMILMLVAIYSCNSSNDSKEDFDEIIPKEVTIGKQAWMTKNLNVDKFSNGDLIPQAKTDEEWEKAGENGQPAWCYYDNDPSNGEKYGKLYNWYAVNDPRGLAPVGFHIPSKKEWQKLVDYLGEDAGKKMKSKSGWDESSGNGSNDSHFSGLPGGYRNRIYNYNGIGYTGIWWSSTEDYPGYAWGCCLSYYDGIAGIHSGPKKHGYSVRCLRD